MNITSLFLINRTQNVIGPEFLLGKNFTNRIHFDDNLVARLIQFTRYMSHLFFLFISQAFKMGKDPLKDSTHQFVRISFMKIKVVALC